MFAYRNPIILTFIFTFFSALSFSTCTPGPANPSITICTPANGQTLTSPVNFTAAANDSHQISAMWVYVDNVNVFKTTPSTINTNLTMAAGAHNVRIQAWDVTGALLQAGVNITVSSTPPPISVSVMPNGSYVLVNGTQQFTAKVSNTSNTSVSWFVDGAAGGSAASGTISAAGVYAAPGAAGSHTITAISVADSTKSGSASVNVVTEITSCSPPAAPAVMICAPTNASTQSSPVHFVVGTNDTHRISAIYAYVDNVFTNKVFGPTMDTNLTMTAGTHNLRVQAWDTTGAILRAAVTITVSAGPPTTSVTVSPNSATVSVNATQQFAATVSNNSNTSVTWSVDGIAGGNSTSGSVDSTGFYTAPTQPGSHTVTAISSADSTKSGSATVTVTAPPSTITIAPKQAVITPDHTQQFNANTSVTWSVDGVAGGNTTVGTMSSTGLYTPPAAAGTHSITATGVSDPSKSASGTLYVTVLSGVYTFHNDMMRTGLNPYETTLTPSNVNSGQFGKLFSRPVDGFVFAQPLYVQGVHFAGRDPLNVVYVATEHGSVYAFDADGGVSAPLWKRSFTNPAAGVTPVMGGEINNYDLGPEAGITGTPVIDKITGTIYLVVRTKEPTGYFQRLHALDMVTGVEKFGGPVAITATVNGSGVGGDGANHINFNPLIENQRAALLLANGMIYIGWASHGDLGSYHGWLIAYDATTLQRTAVWNTTPNGNDGGIWGAGSGMASDDAGNIFASTGNGNMSTSAFDFGDSVVKLDSTLAVTDYFSPSDEAKLNSGDLDLGASGVFLLPDQVGPHPHIAIVCGKRGDIYLVDRDSLGHFQSSGTNTQIVQYLPRALGLNTSGDQFFGVGSYWNENVYFVGSFDHLKQFSVTNGLLSTSPVHLSAEALSSNRSAEPVISANGTSNGIVWVIATNNYTSSSPAILHAYDATDVGTELYNSSQAGTRDLPGEVVKFTTPTVANGRVYMGTRNQLNVFGLLP